MGYEHLSITPETEYDKVIESNAKNLLPIPSECEITLEYKRDCDVPVSTIDVCDDHSEILFDSKIDDDISVYDDDFENIEYVEASLLDPEIVSEEENVVQQQEEEVDLEDISQIQDVVLQLLIDDSILSHELSNSNLEDIPSISRPPLELPDAEEGIPVMMNNIDKFDKDYYFFMFAKVFSLLSAESEDTIFDP
nr:hypothetical protein [Tanacetum cinerariifolium]